MFALVAMGAVMNWASRSPWERYIMDPIVLVLAVSTFMAARAPLTAPAGRDDSLRPESAGEHG